MSRWFLFALFAVLPMLASAQPNIDGVWKTDPKTVTAGSKPSRYIVENGEYRCESCVPKIRIPADGKESPVKGNPYIQKMTARIVDDHTFEVTAWAGKVVTVGRMTVSADGRSMVRDISSHDPNGTTSTSTEMLTRSGPVPHRGHIVSGTWRFATIVKMSDETLTFKTASGTLIMNGSDGSGYDAPMDGTRVPVRNSPGVDTVAVTLKGVASVEEISYAGDKPVWVNVFIVAPDGATMKVNWEDKLRGAKGSFVMVRQ